MAEEPAKPEVKVAASNEPKNSERRDFLKQAASVAVGGAIGAVPACAGIAVYLDPLRRKSAGSLTVKITTLDALPNDGVPRKFSVFADKKDAWTTFPMSPVGAIYLLRTGEKKLKVLNVVCPHAGCFVDFVLDRDEYSCPCHDSTFGKDGSIRDKHSPSPRALDELKYEIRNDNEVWIEFLNFRAGEHDMIPV